LASAGIEDADESASQSTVDEVLDQAVSGFCQGLSARCGREILPVLQTDAASGEPVLLFALNAGDQAVQLWMLASQALLDALPAPSNTEAEPLPARPAANGAGTCPGNVDLLLDVELPVSVSFGRAQLPLKDVIKLTTGSIVELNRSVNEPVEVIVNNCVIARGEVVVVEGNFGVRIQKVISRQERLRTLH
jgi:flagellar motor switch protein FliN/FliY